MSGGVRDASAARAACLGFLASAGAIAILTWLPARFLADWAVYVPDLIGPQAADTDTMSPAEYLAMDRGDFYRALVNAAEALGILAAIYWVAAYLLGAGRIAPSRSRFAGPSALLGAALVVSTALTFIVAAPRFVVGPLIDACTPRYLAAHPELASSDIPIHHCQGRIYLCFMLGHILIVTALLAASLRRRYRQRLPADTA